MVFLLHAQFLDAFDLPELHADDDEQAENRDPENGQAFIDDIKEAWTDQVSWSNRFLVSMASSTVRLISSATVGMSSMSPIICPIG